jgi:hypothetical protein
MSKRENESGGKGRIQTRISVAIKLKKLCVCLFFMGNYEFVLYNDFGKIKRVLLFVFPNFVFVPLNF